MSSVLEGLRAYLAEQSAVTSLVGKKVFGEKSDQWARRPTVIYSQVAGREPMHLAGVSTLAEANVQLDCWADDKAQAERIDEALREVLHSKRGIVMGEIKVRSSSLLSGPTSDWVDRDDGSDQGAHRVSTVYRIWYRVLEPAA